MKDGESCEVYTPEKKDAKNSDIRKNASKIAQEVLSRYKCDFDLTKESHFRFLMRIAGEFSRNREIQNIFFEINASSHKQDISKTIQSVIEEKSETIDWKSLPFSSEAERQECDVLFLLDDIFIPAHKIMLIKENEYFSTLLTSGRFSEDSGREPVEIKDVSLKTFLSYLHCRYGKKYMPSNLEDMVKLMAYAGMVGDQPLLDTLSGPILEKLQSGEEKLTDSILDDIVCIDSLTSVFYQFSDIKNLFGLNPNSRTLYHLLQSNYLPLYESEIYTILKEWEKKNLEEGQKSGDLLKRDLGFGDHLIDCVNFNNFGKDEILLILNDVVLDDSQKVAYAKQILEELNVKKMRAFSFEMKTDSSGQKASLSLDWPLSPDEILSKKIALKETREFQMFGHTWKIELEEVKDYKHGVYLTLKTAPKTAIKLSLKWTFGKTTKHLYSNESSFIEKDGGKGEWFGKGANDGPPLDQLIEDGRLHIKLECKKL